MKLSVAGFRFAGISSGIKTSGRPDLALLAADADIPVAAVFTRNRIKGAPVTLSQERAKAGLARAVVVNSGNANSCTGKPGLEDAQRITRGVARGLQADERRVLAASTGIIGVRLPLDNILERVDELCTEARPDGFSDFATAILTSDRGPKVAYAEVGLGRTRIRLLGCAKGAAMVAPNMATTLAFIGTDAAVDGRWMRGVLREEVELTFNDASVDGDTSTNDSLFLFASGRAANKPLDGGPHGRAFRSALRDVLDDLASQIVTNGIGATRTVTIEVAGATDVKTARLVARRIGSSVMVKTALAGANPDWGRILSVVGNTGIDLDADRIDLHIGGVHLVKGGVSAGGDSEARAAAAMAKETFTIRLHLHAGHAEGRHLTCDLTSEYATITAEQRP
ncbi:MAG: bifunctional glutamate N-acetyltransferase/amino-acid acetyltransferase ArgJ [Myxococcales bacterium]|nr:bifunctional glutamate N-acetyltransferase/amino-acid acetyltransferase ArgJ [Myxococcales bacterium]